MRGELPTYFPAASSKARPGVFRFSARSKVQASITQRARLKVNMVTKKELLAAATVSDPRWAAVVARDPAADGKFVYSVKTTGVYCRPSCGARPPRPENVAFHATVADAERAGFRPCKRCKPDQPSRAEQHAAKVAELCRFIESAEELPTLGELAKRAGMSAYHLHRVFKDVTGLSPKAYAAAHRAKRIRQELDRSDKIGRAHV